MRTTIQRLLSAVLLLAWIAPTAGALGVGLHLVLEHHGATGAAHEREVSDLARAVAHGHHHDAEAAPDHGHDARIDGSAPTLRFGPSLLAALPTIAASTGALGERSTRDHSARHGPLRPLATLYCSLLL